MSDVGGSGDEVGGEQILHALGYKQELNRAVSVLGSIALVVSDITPTASLLVIGPVVIATAGSGSLWAYIIGCFIAINVALCMGELGSMFPVAGGLYSIVTRVLGRPVGFLALLDYIGQAVFLPASVAIGIGVYVQALNPGIPSNIAATVVMIAVTVIAMLRINFNAVLTGVFLLIELIVVTVLALAGFSHWQQPLTILTNPVMGDGSAVGLPLIFTAVATAMFSVNGYDSAINFSEETKGSASHVGQAVVRAAMIGIVFELIPFIAIVFGAPDLGKFIGSPTPLTDVARSAFGDTFVNIITYGAIIAIFNASLAITLQFARIVWSSGRDRAWPGPISDAIAQVHPTLRTPWVATILTGACAAILCFQSTLVTVVTFTAVLLIVLYALIALSALVSRMRQASLPRPYRMPFWPVPPLIALVGTIVAITQQKTSDLLIVGAIVVIGLIYYFLFLEPRKDRYWNMSTDSGNEMARLHDQA
ncbi:MAG: APC family permease [Candidatus Limnocylindrales bacterium]